jgi:chemotaxis protein CheX
MQSDNHRHITALLNVSLSSIHELVSIETDKPNLVNTPIIQTDYGVLIGMVGDIKGRIFILGTETMFAQAGLAMYGVELTGDMLESFVGEFGNTVAGHAATKLSTQGIMIDIAPPTTMQGRVKFGGFSKAIAVPFRMGNRASGQLVLAVEET